MIAFSFFGWVISLSWRVNCRTIELIATAETTGESFDIGSHNTTAISPLFFLSTQPFPFLNPDRIPLSSSQETASSWLLSAPSLSSRATCEFPPLKSRQSEVAHKDGNGLWVTRPINLKLTETMRSAAEQWRLKNLFKIRQRWNDELGGERGSEVAEGNWVKASVEFKRH